MNKKWRSGQNLLITRNFRAYNMIENGMHNSIILITLLCKFNSFRYQYLFSANFIYHNYQILISFNLNPDPPPFQEKLQTTMYLHFNSKNDPKKNPMEFSFFMTKLSKKKPKFIIKKTTCCCMYMYIVSLYYVGLYACYIIQFFSKVFLLRVSKPPSLANIINARTTDYNHRKCYVLTHTSLL